MLQTSFSRVNMPGSKIRWIMKEVLLLALLVSMLCIVSGIEVKWTPADGDGPEPASARYREQMAKLRELEAQQGGGGGGHDHHQHHGMQQQQQQQQVGLLDYILYMSFSSIREIKNFAFKHPKTTALTVMTSLGGLKVYQSSQTSGLLLSRRPYVCAIKPPLTFLVDLLDEKLPSASSTSSLGGMASKGYKKKKKKNAEGEEGGGGGGKHHHETIESIVVGKGQVAYERAAHLIKTFQVLDGLPEEIRFFTTSEGKEGIFQLKHNGFWRLMPVRMTKNAGRVKKSKSSKKEGSGKKMKGEVYEEVLLESLRGSPWKGELRISTSWSNPDKGGDDSVRVEVAWLTSTHSRSTAPGKKELISHILSRAEELVERELAIYRVRERQQQAMAEDAKRAALERSKKAREALLNPPPDKKKWKKMNRGSSGGGDGPARWQPSADLAARRNPRRGG